MTLKELEATLSKAEKRMYVDSINQLRKDLILSLDEMRTGVATTRTQSSMQATIAMTPRGKRYPKDLKLRVESRVSAKRPGFTSDYSLGDDNQLVLGFGDEEETPESQKGSPPKTGFDPDEDPAVPATTH